MQFGHYDDLARDYVITRSEAPETDSKPEAGKERGFVAITGAA
jgi:hypothetical protein